MTGATGGIGLATARQALDQGWNLVLTGRSARVDEVAEQVGPPERVRGIVADSTDPDALVAAVRLADGAFGGCPRRSSTPA
ncbi:SDR family NAD(P)-dependent oxidoreductase [uncultured Pseudonocardia sp.]|uniref:SDR family NAD(P)-dependent oxidoreductase n=1 Tax=uncultured Pseudonocardia sp. TaxID=211455 RepID=UPI00345BB693